MEHSGYVPLRIVIVILAPVLLSTLEHVLALHTMVKHTQRELPFVILGTGVEEFLEGHKMF